MGLAWLAVALVAQPTIPFTQLGFWIGHCLELGGLLFLGAPAVADLHRAGASRPLVGGLRATELVAQEEAFLGARVRSLLLALATKDTATEGHTRRVAMLGVPVGAALGLPRRRLRNLALGGLLHDIGKLSVPRAVLQKPGPLDDAEFAAIRRHPDAGVRLLAELGGFPPAVLRLVRDHHERLDGSGYPGALQAGDMDVETRVLAVCEVHAPLGVSRAQPPAPAGCGAVGSDPSFPRCSRAR